jgi:hypothetical protein
MAQINIYIPEKQYLIKMNSFSQEFLKAQIPTISVVDPKLINNFVFSDPDPTLTFISDPEMDAEMEVFEVGDFCSCSLRGRMTLGLGGYRPGQS